MAEVKRESKKPKNQISTYQELQRLGTLIKRLNDDVDKLLKKMKEKSRL